MARTTVCPVLDLGERLALREATSRAPLEGLARELAADLETVASALCNRVLAAERRLEDHDDPAVVALAERFVHSTAGAMLSALAYGVPMDGARPTSASIAMLQRLGQREDGLAIALRTQRLLSAELWQVWAAFTGGRIGDRSAHQSLLAESTRQLAAYTDCVCERLTCEWPETLRRRRRGIDVAVEELVSRAVCADAEAATAALTQLGYEADAFHLAVALPQSVGREELEKLSRRLKLACAANALAEGCTVWIGFSRSSTAADVERARPLLALEGPIGLGDVGAGLDGFRSTRQQAVDAQRVATLSRTDGITKYRDVALLAVLLADETRAREFARVELGSLAVDDDLAVRLRETITVYLDAGESQVEAAKRLFIHQKTVKYRLRQAEERLGRRISERRRELAAALVVHRCLSG